LNFLKRASENKYSRVLQPLSFESHVIVAMMKLHTCTRPYLPRQDQQLAETKTLFRSGDW